MGVLDNTNAAVEKKGCFITAKDYKIPFLWYTGNRFWNYKFSYLKSDLTQSSVEIISHLMLQTLKHYIATLFHIKGILLIWMKTCFIHYVACNENNSNDNGVRILNFASSKNLVVKSTMFPHRNIHKYTWTSPDGQTHNQIDHILIDRRRHSSIIDAQSF